MSRPSSKSLRVQFERSADGEVGKIVVHVDGRMWGDLSPVGARMLREQLREAIGEHAAHFERQAAQFVEAESARAHG